MQITGLFSHREKQSFNHAKEIVKPYGQINHIIEWCKSELTEDAWAWQMVEMSTPTRPGRYIFYFDVPKDCFAFTIKWVS